ncbi:hypothetical protein [Polluticaenibacter yanchengensis]|uniref:Uncharacterized protein n=1 Tax=Polluticaenibacter yanchengensis TaxID=3014562 RepID=A0ABT4UK98_9BACT|nr:hypothetical protein [Chitinophagaceae bacterium LY-5]
MKQELIQKICENHGVVTMVDGAEIFAIIEIYNGITRMAETEKVNVTGFSSGKLATLLGY